MIESHEKRKDSFRFFMRCFRGVFELEKERCAFRLAFVFSVFYTYFELNFFESVKKERINVKYIRFGKNTNPIFAI